MQRKKPKCHKENKKELKKGNSKKRLPRIGLEPTRLTALEPESNMTTISSPGF